MEANARLGIAGKRAAPRASPISWAGARAHASLPASVLSQADSRCVTAAGLPRAAALIPAALAAASLAAAPLRAAPISAAAEGAQQLLLLLRLPLHGEQELVNVGVPLHGMTRTAGIAIAAPAAATAHLRGRSRGVVPRNDAGCRCNAQQRARRAALAARAAVPRRLSRTLRRGGHVAAARAGGLQRGGARGQGGAAGRAAREWRGSQARDPALSGPAHTGDQVRRLPQARVSNRRQCLAAPRQWHRRNR